MTNGEWAKLLEKRCANMQKQMTDLRTAAQQALEAMEQLAVLAEYGTTGPGKCDSSPLNQKQATSLRLAVSDISRAQISNLRAALAEPVQEPVAWRVQRSDGQYELYFLKAAAERAAECYIKRPPVEPLYTAPPQRKPLTEEEIYAAIKGVDSLRAVEVARAIEKAHGIGDKNGK